jgi:hypothetical protein
MHFEIECTMLDDAFNHSSSLETAAIECIRVTPAVKILMEF